MQRMAEHRATATPPLAPSVTLTSPQTPAMTAMTAMTLAMTLAMTAAMPLSAAGAASPGLPPAARPALGVDADKLRTVVMGLAPRRGVRDKELVLALSDVILNSYSSDPRRMVIGPDDIRRALDWEASRQQAGCDDSKCLAEVGAALDATRIVSGSMDVLGDGYMITLSEIDAKTLEPLSRVQEQVKKDETALVASVKKMADELQRKAGVTVATSAARGFSALAGSIEVTSDPRGAQVLVAGELVGTTPTRFDNVAPGRHRVRLVRADYEPVDAEVPVFAGGSTQLDAQLRIDRRIAEQNYAARTERHKDAQLWHQVGGWSKAGLGTGLGVCGGIGTAAYASRVGPLDACTLGAAACTLGGLGLLAWGVTDLFTPPEPPVAEWEMERKVTIRPPPGAGELEVKVLQPAAAAQAH